jgi:glycerol uptake facilitator protein
MSGKVRRAAPLAWLVGELVGTFILVFVGCGCVATAVLTGAQVGIFQVAIIWGLGVSTAIYVTGGISGAHLNPAVTVASAVWDGFSWAKVPRYVVAQFAGAFLAGAAVYAVYGGVLGAYEAAHHIVRGSPGSEATAMIFGEYYPNPSGRPIPDAARASVTLPVAFLAEAVGTAILMLVIRSCADPRNSARPRVLAPATIGLTVTILISLLGPLTMAALNPARDLAPRIFSSLAGWGTIPFTVNGAGWWAVYVVAPLMGAVAGGGLHCKVLAPRYVEGAESQIEAP